MVTVPAGTTGTTNSQEVTVTYYSKLKFSVRRRTLHMRRTLQSFHFSLDKQCIYSVLYVLGLETKQTTQ